MSGFENEPAVLVKNVQMAMGFEDEPAVLVKNVEMAMGFEDEPAVLVKNVEMEENEEKDLFCASSMGVMGRLREMGWTLVLGIFIVYGVGQGVGVAFYRVVVDYYWKDVQLAQPSAVQFYRGISSLSWDVKPLWGLLTDAVPVAGYHRRPYFVLAGILGVGSTLLLAFEGRIHAAVAVSLLAAALGSIAIADVTIDAVAAKTSREKPELAAAVQSLCSASIGFGHLLGYGFSGLAVDSLGPQGALGLLAIPSTLCFVLGLVLHEEHVPQRFDQVGRKVWNTSRKMWSTLKCSAVWRPTLYMFLSWAMCPEITEGKFFFYTNSERGLNFSQEFIGLTFAMGSVGSIVGVFIYYRSFKDLTFRRILLVAQLLLALSGMLDLALVTRLNLKLHIPDSVFVVIDESSSRIVSRFKWLPMLVLSARLCPSGIEGTFFALLMSIDNIGILLAGGTGGLLLKVFGVTRDNFDNLWLVVVVRNIARLFPLLFLFLVPKTDPTLDILSQQTDLEDDKVELLPLHQSSTP